jgi:hypothetical protein
MSSISTTSGVASFRDVHISTAGAGYELTVFCGIASFNYTGGYYTHSSGNQSAYNHSYTHSSGVNTVAYALAPHSTMSPGSNTFTTTNGYPTQIVAASDPGTTSGPTVPSHTVKLQDAGGTDCTGTSAVIEVQLGTTGAGVGLGATLGGTKTVSSVAGTGVATFTNLTISVPGTGYTLVYSAYPHSTHGATCCTGYVTATPFEVTSGTPVNATQVPKTVVATNSSGGNATQVPITVVATNSSGGNATQVPETGSYKEQNGGCDNNGPGACDCNVGYDFACAGSTLISSTNFTHTEGADCCWKMVETSTPSASGEGHLAGIGMQLQFKTHNGTMRSDCQCATLPASSHKAK